MRDLVVYACLLTSLFYFSEGKPCPEKSRPHKTRCDAFYKCRQLPSNSHVWVPVKCKEGLVYEHNVGSCVLPGEDWECLTASELISTSTSLPDKASSSIVIVNNKDEAGLLLRDDDVEIVLDATLSSEEEEQDDDAQAPVALPLQANRVAAAVQQIDEDVAPVSQFDSSGDGELVELEGHPQQAENREVDADISSSSNNNSKQKNYNNKLHEHSAESSDVSSSGEHSGSPIDPKLTAHLQRLQQLIDGLQQKYQKTDKPQLEMRPDQLNAFLAHFDLKNRYDMLNPLGSYKDATESTTTTMLPPATVAMTHAPSTSTTSAPTPLPEPTVNKTRLQEHLSKHRMQPETKLLLSNAQPYGPGYANSQIVVNRPEGSVMFTLPQYGLSSAEQQQLQAQQHQQQQQQPAPPPASSASHEYGEHEPKISEETLKTVLELSKQMIAAQNLPKVLPNPAYNGAYYAPPILQPVILAPHGGNPFQQYYQHMPSYSELPQPTRTHYVHHKKPAGYSHKQPSTTIIHNNVIPVHVSSTNSGEKEVIDTYGNSLGVLPSLDRHHSSHNNQLQADSESSSSNNNNNNNNNNGNNYYNKFIATMTTSRPSSGPMTMTTMSSQYTGQYGAPFASDYTQTTPSPATVATYYTPSPHLDEHNVNRVFQAESYPTVVMSSNMPRPMDGMFPSQLEAGQVKIRPNSQKIESMEVEADEAMNGNYVNGHNSYSNPSPNLNPHQNNRHNVLTYSSSGAGSGGSSEMLGMSQQLAPASTYVEHSFAISQNAVNEQQQQQQQQQHPFKSPFMVRPTPSMSTSIYSDAAGNMDMSMFSSMTGSGGHSAMSMPSMPGKLKLPSGSAQLVNFNGNFISLDVFQKSILPLLTQSPTALSDLGNVEVITCQAGVRQPNQTDCTRYFVCSKKDGKVLSYSCPPYTGFNKQTRICDAMTYAQCGNVPSFNGYTIDENRRLQMEALKVLAEAKRRQEATLKAQNLASLLQQLGSHTAEPTAPAMPTSIEQTLMDSYMVSFPEVPSTTMRPMATAAPSVSPISSSSGTATATGSGSSSVKKRKYYCKEGDKIPDQTSISSYFVCYKNAQGQMKGHKMTCSKGLLFCPKTLLCTLASKCSG
ncbi:hypothetical protein KR222_010335 [Zaprionus bogoriensis]|nr:hypothetical protein KR222_010335 [Zaprionus bogoriensis]